MSKEKQIEEMAKQIKYMTGAYTSDAEDCATVLYEQMNYRKQSKNMVEVVRCYDCKYCEVVTDSIIDEPKYFCTRMVGSMPIDPTDYCSRAKMKGGAERVYELPIDLYKDWKDLTYTKELLRILSRNSKSR